MFKTLIPSLCVVHFKPGSVARLERGENGGGWTVTWFLRPELLG